MSDEFARDGLSNGIYLPAGVVVSDFSTVDTHIFYRKFSSDPFLSPARPPGGGCPAKIQSISFRLCGRP